MGLFLALRAIIRYALETCVSVYHVCAAHGSLIALPVDVSVVKSDVRL